MGKKPKNISISDFRRYLIHKELKKTRTKGGHEIWVKSELTRPVVLQTHINPIPLFILKNNLRTMNETMEDLLDFLSK